MLDVIFTITSYSDANQPLGNWFTINRANGQVNVNATLAVSGAFQGGTIMYPTSDAGFYFQTQATQKLISWSPSWYDAWNVSTGARGWIGPNGNLLSLDGNGNLGAIGAINCNGDMYAGSGSVCSRRA